MGSVIGAVAARPSADTTAARTMPSLTHTTSGPASGRPATMGAVRVPPTGMSASVKRPTARPVASIACTNTSGSPYPATTQPEGSGLMITVGASLKPPVAALNVGTSSAVVFTTSRLLPRRTKLSVGGRLSYFSAQASATSDAVAATARADVAGLPTGASPQRITPASVVHSRQALTSSVHDDEQAMVPDPNPWL